MGKQSAIGGELPSVNGEMDGRLAHQEDFRCYFMLADYQALARRGLRGCGMRQAIRKTVGRYVEAGFDPARSACFLQSQVPQLAELAAILANLVPLTDLLSKHIRKRGTAPAGATLGVVGYPVTQVADILAFGTTHVLALDRHRENIRLASDVATRFNDAYGEVFQRPEPVLITTEGTGTERPIQLGRQAVQEVLDLGGSEARVRAQLTLENVREAIGIGYAS